MRGLPSYGKIELYDAIFQAWERDGAGYANKLWWRESALGFFNGIGFGISQPMLHKVTQATLDHFVEKGALFYDKETRCWWPNRDYDEFGELTEGYDD